MSMDDLDGVIAAPDHHKVVFENDAVRVLETTIRAGDITPLHTHLTPTVLYVISGSHFIRRDEHGATIVDTRADPDFVLPGCSTRRRRPATRSRTRGRTIWLSSGWSFSMVGEGLQRERFAARR
jgi:hypothetical protein